MTIRVRFFAIVRQKAGVPHIDIETARETTVSSTLVALVKFFPEIAPHLASCAFAVNQTYVPVDTVLNENDELAIIPPVSGG